MSPHDTRVLWSPLQNTPFIKKGKDNNYKISICIDIISRLFLGNYNHNPIESSRYEPDKIVLLCLAPLTSL